MAARKANPDAHVARIERLADEFGVSIDSWRSSSETMRQETIRTYAALVAALVEAHREPTSGGSAA